MNTITVMKCLDDRGVFYRLEGGVGNRTGKKKVVTKVTTF